MPAPSVGSALRSQNTANGTVASPSPPPPRVSLTLSSNPLFAALMREPKLGRGTG
jgi:hypothetical protein